MNILITGSTGQLGTALLQQLTGTSNQVTITSRRKPPEETRFKWVYSDLLTGEGLEEAAEGANIIIHAATSPMKRSRDVDVTGFKQFLSKTQHVDHFIYPSIVGIDQIPYSYYKQKRKAETLLENSAIPYTIIRATQFHQFVDKLFLSKPYLQRYVIPRHFKCQSVDVNEFAAHLLSAAEKAPQRRAADFGGPAIMTLKQMAELKITLNREQNKVLSIPLPGKLSKAFAEGKNTNEARRMGTVTFEEYLRNKRE